MLNLDIKQHTTTFVFLAATLFSLTACSSQYDKEKLTYELTGTVMDSVTKQPIEGAYVLVAYYGGGGTAFGHNSRWCQKTLGMYTKADGKYRFPAVSSNSVTANMPISVPMVIKPGYRNVAWVVTNDVDQSRKRKLWLTDQNLTVAPQDPAKPDMNYQSVQAYCYRASTKPDAAAAIEFLKIELREFIAYGKSEAVISDTKRTIADFEALPSIARPTKQ
jgi:hypothetical protein